MKKTCGLNNEDGSVLIVALVMLVLLTLIGISATTTSEIETKIAGNDRVFKRNFYFAEAGGMQCVEDLEGVADPQTNPPSYLQPIGTITYETYDTTLLDNAWFAANSNGSIEANTRFLASSEGLAGGKLGTSLDMTKSNIHAYNLYGRWFNAADPARGRLIVQVGYRKAF